jgi:hypothetical protein
LHGLAHFLHRSAFVDSDLELGAEFAVGLWLLVIRTLFELSADFLKVVPVIAVNEVGHCFCGAGLLVH